MPEKQPGEPPSRWTVINDYSKTVVTVCAALLAFIGAGSSKLLEAQLSPFATNTVIAIVGLLALSALFSLAVPAMLDRYLCVADKGQPNATTPATAKNIDESTVAEWNSRPTRIRNVKVVANLSYIFLALAVVAMAIFAVSNPFKNAATEKQKADKNPRSETAPARYEIAYSAPHKTSKGEKTHTFLLNQSTGEIWQMVCAPDGVVSFRKLQRRDVNGNLVVESPVNDKIASISPRP